MPKPVLSAFADEAVPDTRGQIDVLLEAGLTHIDIRKLDGFTVTDLPPDHAEAVRQLYDEAGIRVHMFGSAIGKTDITDDFDAELVRLEHLARLKPIFDCSSVRMFSFHNQNGLPHGAWRDASLERLRRLKDRAWELGLVLYHENETHIFGDAVEDVLTIAELRDDAFRLIYDFANYRRTGMPGWETWRRVGHITDAFHFKDQCVDKTHVPMGQGDTDATAIVCDAMDNGFSGSITIEPHLHLNAHVSPQDNPRELFLKAVRASKDLLETATARAENANP